MIQRNSHLQCPARTTGIVLTAMAALACLNCAGTDDVPPASDPVVSARVGDRAVGQLELTDGLLSPAEPACDDKIRVIPVGGGVRASLEEADCTGEQGGPQRRYGLVIATAQSVRLEIFSSDFNPAIALRRADGSEMATAVGDGELAEVRARLVPGAYTVTVGSNPADEARGVFQLDVWNACLEQRAVSMGESVRERLEPGDCTIDDVAVDTYTLDSVTPLQATVYLETPRHPAVIRVLDEAGVEIFSAEAPADTSVTEASFVAPAGTYLIEVRSIGEHMGDYRLTVAPQPCTEMASAARSGRVDETCRPERAIRESREAFRTSAMDRELASPVDPSPRARR